MQAHVHRPVAVRRCRSGRLGGRRRRGFHVRHQHRHRRPARGLDVRGRFTEVQARWKCLPRGLGMRMDHHQHGIGEGWTRCGRQVQHINQPTQGTAGQNTRPDQTCRVPSPRPEALHGTEGLFVHRTELVRDHPIRNRVPCTAAFHKRWTAQCPDQGNTGVLRKTNHQHTLGLQIDRCFCRGKIICTDQMQTLRTFQQRRDSFDIQFELSGKDGRPSLCDDM
mmetsp:Transcript_10556/g.64887  ORF Transcript_10556/g.64887 Transcript_10556/m.64887 type:complete len:222 (-) Transcript_10556:1339-2004(-)